MTLKTISAFETERNIGPYRVHAPTEEQYLLMIDRLTHGETAFTDIHPELLDTFDFELFLSKHPEIEAICMFDLNDADTKVMNCINEYLAGPAVSARDFVELCSDPDLWHERDLSYLKKITINEHGCWELPKYNDYIKPGRARYPLPRTYSREHGDIRQQMGAAWMWERVIGPIPDDKLANGRRAFRPDHRCNNKSCVYPRHTVLGTPQANDAFTARMDMMEDINQWQSAQWARPSFAYPDGIEGIVHASEVTMLSNRSVMLPISMSRKELKACMDTLIGKSRLPDGGYTTDPGYHVLLGAMKKGLDFDETSGCWNARMDLDQLSPHRLTITHPCGSKQCCNPRHMDIRDDHKKYYELQSDSYVTLPNGNIVNIMSGEILPSYWESWNLYWNWLREHSIGDGEEQLLGEVDFSHMWVHPLTGCWENERFYPRWSSSGAQQNAYGFHRASYGEYGRSTHRYLLHKYLEHLGEEVVVDMGKDADHCCDNRRCCNPLHMQLRSKKEHSTYTYERRKQVLKQVRRLQKLRRLGMRR